MTTLPKGRGFLLKVSNGNADQPVYQTTGGFRKRSFSISEGAVAITGSGIFLGSAAEAQVRANAMAGMLDDYELSFENGEKLRGRFLVQKLNYEGDFNGERNYTISLSGSGEFSA
jgi:predicted secreted protein